MYAPFVPAVAAAMAQARRRIETSPSLAPTQKGRSVAGPPPAANSNVASGYLPAAVSALMSSGTAAL